MKDKILTRLFFGLLIITFLILIFMIGFSIVKPFVNGGTGVYTITDKTIRQNADGHYLVFATNVETNTKEVFEICDTWINGIFNASDIYGDIEVGATYTLKLKGFRIPLFSEYKMIVSYEQADEPAL